MVLLFATLASACTTTTLKQKPTGSGEAFSSIEASHSENPQGDLGAQWVKHAAEYHAITRQVYAVATRDLPRFVGDKSWSAMPGFRGHSERPPAVILDVDETVVSNVDFQLTFERPFANHKLDDWSSNYVSRPISGVVEFVAAARATGVTVFFVTNRPCQTKVGTNDPCPQKTTTIDDIRELGIDVDADHVMLSGERVGWNREKLSRREFVAKTHRVIMLFGDDLGDFVPCARKKVVTPCTVAGTRASRLSALDTYEDYWGSGWYVFPNPMHGSWTSAQ
jgi:acid phosphatase